MLKSKARNSLPASDFGEPGERNIPMPDRSHAGNAKARAKQQLNAGKLSRGHTTRSSPRQTVSSSRTMLRQVLSRTKPRRLFVAQIRAAVIVKLICRIFGHKPQTSELKRRDIRVFTHTAASIAGMWEHLTILHEYHDARTEPACFRRRIRAAMRRHPMANDECAFGKAKILKTSRERNCGGGPTVGRCYGSNTRLALNQSRLFRE